MRAVALGICPDATLVDITHEIGPQDVLGGALELAAAYKYFPAGTIFLCVVDPGVGSKRRGIAAGAGGYCFVAPDNGLLTTVFRETPPERVVELTNREYARPRISATFEGRDRFAPAAAWLATGVPLDALGTQLTAWETLDIPEPSVAGDELVAVVLRVDRFGNLVTNVDRRTFDAFADAKDVQIAAGGHRIGSVVRTYAEVEDGSLCALFGSSDHLEIAVNGGSAADRLQGTRGMAISVRLRSELTGSSRGVRR